jgi:hypothetical protein
VEDVMVISPSPSRIRRVKLPRALQVMMVRSLDLQENRLNPTLPSFLRISLRMRRMGHPFA